MANQLLSSILTDSYVSDKYQQKVLLFIMPKSSHITNSLDLESAIEEEINKNLSQTSFRRQDSDATRMYN